MRHLLACWAVWLVYGWLFMLLLVQFFCGNWRDLPDVVVLLGAFSQPAGLIGFVAIAGQKTIRHLPEFWLIATYWIAWAITIAISLVAPGAGPAPLLIALIALLLMPIVAFGRLARWLVRKNAQQRAALRAAAE